MKSNLERHDMKTTKNSKSTVARHDDRMIWHVLAVTVLTAAALVVGILSAAASPSSISVVSAWIPHAPPGMSVHAGYLELKNNGPKNMELVAVSSPAYESVELHLSKIVDGIATMEKLAQISIAPGQVVKFKPGGLHLMLLKPQREVAVGDKIPLLLSFSDGTTVDAIAMVEKRGSEMPHHQEQGHEHMHHSG
jgi:periplasmic copper chaperone A